MDKKWRDDNALSRAFCREEERTPALERDKERERESFLLLLLRRGRGDAFDENASSFLWWWWCVVAFFRFVRILSAFLRK